MSISKRWLVIGAVLLAVTVFGSLLWQIRSLQRQLATKVDVLTQEDLVALERKLTQGVAATISREVAGLHETLTLEVDALGRRLFGRLVTRPPVPGPAGPPGQPGAPGKPGEPAPGAQPGTARPTTPGGQPGTPLIPPGQAPQARLQAIERVLVGFDPGHLLNCPTAGLPADTIELLRDPTGRLASTAPCVASVDDRVRLPVPPPPTVARSRFKLVGAVSRQGLGYGLAYEVAHVWRFNADTLALVSPAAIGAGLSYNVTDTFGAGAAYLYSLGSREWQPWLYVTARP